MAGSYLRPVKSCAVDKKLSRRCRLWHGDTFLMKGWAKELRAMLQPTVAGGKWTGLNIMTASQPPPFLITESVLQSDQCISLLLFCSSSPKFNLFLSPPPSVIVIYKRNGAGRTRRLQERERERGEREEPNGKRQCNNAVISFIKHVSRPEKHFCVS